MVNSSKVFTNFEGIPFNKSNLYMIGLISWCDVKEVKTDYFILVYIMDLNNLNTWSLCIWKTYISKQQYAANEVFFIITWRICDAPTH